MENQFKEGDRVIHETLHNAYGIHTVIRVTPTQAVLDNGEKLPISGVDGCHHIKNCSNHFMVHYQTYYRMPNAEVEERAKKRGFIVA